MDLGIAGRTAIVCGASAGLGRACAEALAREGVALVLNARTEPTLAATAEAIAHETGVPVRFVAGDVAEATVRECLLAACPEPDILVNNGGGPPRGDFRAFGAGDWAAATDRLLIPAIEMIRLTVDGMVARRFGRVVNVTSFAVLSPTPDLCLSTAARAGLTAFCAGLGRQTIRANVTFNNLLPQNFATARQREGVAVRARATGRTEEAVLADMLAGNPAGRLGDPREFGEACAFFCGARSGYVTGQNIMMDGGRFTGAF